MQYITLHICMQYSIMHTLTFPRYQPPIPGPCMGVSRQTRGKVAKVTKSHRCRESKLVTAITDTPQRVSTQGIRILFSI